MLKMFFRISWVVPRHCSILRDTKLFKNCVTSPLAADKVIAHVHFPDSPQEVCVKHHHLITTHPHFNSY